MDLGNPRSKVSINSGTISKNQAKSGAGVFASGYYFAFAAIFREDPLGVGTPDNPGMYINGGVNKDVDISSNKATEMGGGVLYAGLKDTVKAQIYNANISDNTAASGAGVMNYKYWTQLDIDGCIISNNEATSNGGGVMATSNSDGGYTSIKDTTITDNISGDRGAGVYYDINSEIRISGADIIQDNTYNGKLNNLNILSLKKPVKVIGDLTGSKIGLSDPTLWDDDKEDTDESAVSTKRLTDGFKANNDSLIPADAFTSDHESWVVDFGEKYVSPKTEFKYTAQQYDNTLDLPEGYDIHTRDNGEIYIKVPATQFTGYTEKVSDLYTELCYLYDNNSNCTFVKDFELYGYLSDYPGKVYYDKINKFYVAVWKVANSSVYVLTSSDPDSFESYTYDYALFMASAKVQQFMDGDENTLCLKVYYYYDETDISGLFDDTYTEKELVYSEPLDFEGAQTKTIYKINEYGFATTKYVISKDSEDDGSYDYTGEVRLVRRTAPVKFHVNEPNKADKLFRVYNGDASEAEDTTAYTLTNGKVEAFYNIPSFAGDNYVFAGWYYNSSDGTTDGETAFDFDSTVPANVTDVYAHWIPVGEVNKAEGDDKDLPSEMNGKYSGFELFGVQIRPEAQFDQNMGEYYYGGLRFVTSISENLLSEIDALSDETVNGNKVEYGFVTAAESTIEAVVGDSRMGIDASTYKIQYKGENVNGVDTLLANKTPEQRQTPNNFRYVTNVDCTSQQGGYGSDSRVKFDHQNYGDYRLATYVVTYNNHPENQSKEVVARAYMRYYDANGLLRTFYNDYTPTNVYGGCSVSYDTALSYVGKSKTAVAE